MSLTSSRTNDESPLFSQIVDHFRREIDEGRLGEHEALPSERAVAESHGVSRMTARRALEAVEAEGLAYSEGRKGRFVSPQRLRYDIGKMVSFVADAHAAGTDLEIDLVSKGRVKADRELASSLAVPAGEVLYKYTRLFLTNGHATFVEAEYVIAARFPGMLDHDLEQSTTRLLQRHYKTFVFTGDIVVRMRPAQPAEARLLGLTPHTAGIELKQIIRDEWGQPFCFGRQFWRGELAEFSVQAIVNQ